MGVSVVYPNVRGSSGFGKTYLAKDNGFLREDSVKDIGALLDWIAKQPDLDKDKILIMGRSYGGYMTLATAFHYSDTIRCSVDIVGISNFNTFFKYFSPKRSIISWLTSLIFVLLSLRFMANSSIQNFLSIAISSEK